ncbi:hypothetical protein KIW84_034764 [Lathyrus oleraceus]|uniref:Reverse transcriptase zinc-binding domain-containing protein n=1 Tax=Pisum sativum TaxID=3888 RepID=A0A9D4Y3K9_PEA|nr:hypothetical protein KIW84_034764 [Pisum sativum]
MMFKVDFAQAYDYVNWDYLRGMLIKLGFGLKVMHWMEKGVFSSSMFVLINENPTKYFEVGRSLMQVNSGFFKGFQVNESVAYNLIQFVDDTILGLEDDQVNDILRKALKFMWETKVLNKVKTLCWRFLQNKLPTRLQLRARNIIHDPYELVCVFCFHQEEDVDHLFLRCAVLLNVWSNICSWTGYDVVVDVNLLEHLFRSRSYCSGLVECKRLSIIWMAFCWLIYNKRNEMTFGDPIASVIKVVRLEILRKIGLG